MPARLGSGSRRVFNFVRLLNYSMYIYHVYFGKMKSRSSIKREWDMENFEFSAASINLSIFIFLHHSVKGFQNTLCLSDSAPNKTINILVHLNLFGNHIFLLFSSHFPILYRLHHHHHPSIRFPDRSEHHHNFPVLTGYSAECGDVKPAMMARCDAMVSSRGCTRVQFHYDDFNKSDIITLLTQTYTFQLKVA